MTNDLISRSELKKAIENYLSKRQDIIIWETDMFNMLDNAPTVEPFERIGAICNENCGYKPQGRWVSVSEKLPPNYILCLFCDKEGNIFYGHRKSNNLWYEEAEPGNVSDVVAWQELPEPYKEGGTE